MKTNYEDYLLDQKLDHDARIQRIKMMWNIECPEQCYSDIKNRIKHEDHLEWHFKERE